MTFCMNVCLHDHLFDTIFVVVVVAEVTIMFFLILNFTDMFSISHHADP